MLMIKINGNNEGIIEYNTRLMPVFTPEIVSFGSRMINKIQSRQQINSKYFTKFFFIFYLLYSLMEWNRTWNIYKNTIECTKKISKEEDYYEI